MHANIVVYTAFHGAYYWHGLTVDNNDENESSFSLMSFTETIQLPAWKILLHHQVSLLNCVPPIVVPMACLLYTVTAGFGNIHVEFMSRVLCSSNHHPAPPRHSVLTANLYSDIKLDDSPVKGTKKGKGKKKKEKLGIDPFEKKKPKLDELKVFDSEPTLQLRAELCVYTVYLLVVHDMVGSV